MTAFPQLTRRAALVAGGAAPLAVVSGAASASDRARDGTGMRHHAFDLGDMAVTALLAATRVVEDPQSIFGMNVSAEEFANVSAASFIPADKARFYFNPTVVETGGETVLFDAGPSADGALAVLAEAGYAPEDVDLVVLSHMHGDHIGGLMRQDVPAYPNARYAMGQVEFDAWADLGNDGFDTNVRPLADKTSFVGDGDAVAPGIVAMAAFGHTPGHMAYMLDSGGRQALIMADTANHHVWSLAYPDWEVRFDMDKTAAAATRRRVLGMLATDRIPTLGYHMPFPGIGYVETRGDGFRYTPATYQLTL